MVLPLVVASDVANSGRDVEPHLNLLLLYNIYKINFNAILARPAVRLVVGRSQ